MSSTTLFNLAFSESTLNPDAVGDRGCSYGLVQINLCAHPAIATSSALDPEFALSWAAQRLAEGNGWWFTSCTCIGWAKSQGVKIPKGMSAWDLLPNGIPQVGGLVLINGNHVAVITGFSKDGSSLIISEANWSPCKIGTRVISMTDKRIRGFWTPSG